MTFYNILLAIHVLLGSTGLISGSIAIGTRKGSRIHVRYGNIYYYSMSSAATLALILTFMKFNPFLLSLSIFTLYLLYNGKKSIQYWKMKEAIIPSMKEKLPAGIGMLTGLFMILFPVVKMINLHELFVPILSIFGLILVLNAIQDIRLIARLENFQPRNKKWLLKHIGSMGGAYIASMTAFLVNTVHLEPAWIVWLTPSLVGSILITRAVRYWSVKFNLIKS